MSESAGYEAAGADGRLIRISNNQISKSAPPQNQNQDKNVELDFRLDSKKPTTQKCDRDANGDWCSPTAAAGVQLCRRASSSPNSCERASL